MQSSFPQSNTPQIRRAGVDLNGVMSVLSKHLYSTPTVALRELVQNAHDSILRRRLEQPDWQGPSRIEVIGDSASNTVRIVDTGAGLTEHEIHAYLATVGVGYTRGLRQSGHEDSGLIGMFGLGFLSAFVLARRVSVRTTSYQQPELGFCYVSSNAEQYSVTPMPARPVGTEITLELQDEYSALTQAARLREILERYCVLLREPIHVGGDAQPINPEPPPWPPTPRCTRCNGSAATWSSPRVSNMTSSRSAACRCARTSGSTCRVCCGSRTAAPMAPATTAISRFSSAACCSTMTPATCCRPGPGSSAG